jgi:hypothetical protein
MHEISLKDQKLSAVHETNFMPSVKENFDDDDEDNDTENDCVDNKPRFIYGLMKKRKRGVISTGSSPSISPGCKKPSSNDNLATAVDVVTFGGNESGGINVQSVKALRRLSSKRLGNSSRTPAYAMQDVDTCKLVNV